MKLICELNDKIILGEDGLSSQAPRLTARAIVKNQNGLYAVMYSDKWRLHSLPGGGVEDGFLQMMITREDYMADDSWAVGDGAASPPCGATEKDGALYHSACGSMV